MNILATSQNRKDQAKRACISCLRRRRWCDKSLPKCRVCTEALRECEGYEHEEIRTFVNFDASNVSRPNKKRVLSEALVDSKKLRRSNIARPNTRFPSQAPASSSNSMAPWEANRVTNLQVNFTDHVETLWKSFLLGYCQTTDYWPLGCSLLAFKHRVLDLSLVALSAGRLTISAPGSNLLVLGLTAYNDSINLFKNLMEKEHDDELMAILAITSTLYALMDVSLMQPDEVINLGWGRPGHFDGALMLMQKSGPSVFSTFAFHLVFKKIRELAVFLALLRCQKSFLSTREWMEIPWLSYPRTPRDKLYDLMLMFSDVVTSHQANNDAMNAALSKESDINRFLEIEAAIQVWKTSWLNEDCLGDQIRCNCQSLAPFSCTCSLPPSKFPDFNFALLQVDCWALQLLISTTLNKATNSDDGTPSVGWAAILPERSSYIANRLDEASSFPSFKRTTERTPAITEGYCRTMFSNWILREYRINQGISGTC